MPEGSALLAVVHQGPGFGYYWQAGKGSTWFRAGEPRALPAVEDVYFGVNLVARRGGRGDRARSSTVAALGCLYAEFDAKDYGDDKAAALAHVESLTPRPSAVVDSGGGYHCYWSLVEPWQLTSDTERERARGLQARWVERVGGDPGAKDLARVLRVPGTFNTKYSPARLVTLLYLDEGTRYTVAELEALAPTPEPRPAPAPRPITPVTSSPTPGRASAREVIARFNAEHSIDSLLDRYGATRTHGGYACNCGLQHSHETQLAVTRDGRAVFFSARCGWAPSRTDRNGRPIADAFDLFTQVEHGGDKRAALKAYNPITPTPRQPRPVEPAPVDPEAAERRRQDAQRKRDARRAEAAETMADVRARAAEDPLLSRRPAEAATLRWLITIAGDRDWCRPSKARLVELTGYSLGAVKRALMDLEGRGYFMSQGDGGGPNQTALRTFLRGSPPTEETGHSYVDQAAGGVIHESIEHVQTEKHAYVACEATPIPPAPAGDLADWETWEWADAGHDAGELAALESPAAVEPARGAEDASPSPAPLPEPVCCPDGASFTPGATLPAPRNLRDATGWALLWELWADCQMPAAPALALVEPDTEEEPEILGPPRDPEKANTYWALLGKASKPTTSPAQRRALRLKAAAMRETYPASEAAALLRSQPPTSPRPRVLALPLEPATPAPVAPALVEPPPDELAAARARMVERARAGERMAAHGD